MSTESATLDSPAMPTVRERSLSLTAAAWLSVAVTLALAALAFWPARAWAPPLRPTLKGPMVFDEFVNAPTPPAAVSAPDPAAH